MKRIIKKEQGFTLLELMVSLAIGVILLLALGAIYLTALQSNKKRSVDEMMDETARQVFDQFEQELSMAGYVDIFDIIKKSDGTEVPRATEIAKLSDAKVQRNFARIYDTSDPTTVPLTPFQASFKDKKGDPLDGVIEIKEDGKDTLIIRYQIIATNESKAAVLKEFDKTESEGLLGCTNAKIEKGMVFVENKYFLESNSLYCRSNNANSDKQPLVSNVYDMKFRYLVTEPVVDLKATLADSQAGLYVANTFTKEQVEKSSLKWGGVTAVEVCIVAASDPLSGKVTEIASFQPTIPSCNRQADGSFAAETARLADDAKLYRRYVKTFNIPNSLYFVPGEIK